MRASKHLYSLDVVNRQVGKVETSARVAGIVNLDAIDEDKGVLRFGTAKKDRRYCARPALPDNVEAGRELAVVWDSPLTVLGELAEGAPAVSLKSGERLSPLAPGGYDAFRTPSSQNQG